MEKLDQLVGPICCCTVTVGDLCMKGTVEVEDVLQLMDCRQYGSWDNPICFANSILMVEAIFQTNDMLKHGHMVISLPVFRHFSTSYALTVR